MRNALIAGALLLTVLTIFITAKRSNQEQEAIPAAELRQTARVRHSARAVTSETPTDAAPATVAAPVEAKDTPEAKQVEALLAKHGLDPAALPVAYDYAYEYNRMGRLTGQSEGARFHLQQAMVPHRRKLEKYGPIPPALLEDLTRVPATVFWPQPNTNVKAPIPVDQ
jgi:hypothetical protein